MVPCARGLFGPRNPEKERIYMLVYHLSMGSFF